MRVVASPVPSLCSRVASVNPGEWEKSQVTSLHTTRQRSSIMKAEVTLNFCFSRYLCTVVGQTVHDCGSAD